MGWWGFKPYVSVAARRAKAARHAAKLAKKGQKCCPVELDGRDIARTFWGKAWCDNLESYSDFANRLPRGRTYVRNGSVIDLQIEPGRVTAIVSGSEIYEIDIKIKPLIPKTWGAIKSRCAGQIASLVELLQGKLSRGVMDIVTCRDGGLFPTPGEISLDCSCPDWADMCKHVAAVLYGVGARLDERPELLFKLRKVDHLELIEKAGSAEAIPGAAKTGKKTIAADQLADVFGIEFADAPRAAAPQPVKRSGAGRKRVPPEHRAEPGEATRDKARSDPSAPRAGRVARETETRLASGSPSRRRKRVGDVSV